MDENKFVTLEMFEQYHKNLMGYITGRDGSTSEEECDNHAADGDESEE